MHRYAREGGGDETAKTYAGAVGAGGEPAGHGVRPDPPAVSADAADPAASAETTEAETGVEIAISVTTGQTPVLQRCNVDVSDDCHDVVSHLHLQEAR